MRALFDAPHRPLPALPSGARRVPAKAAASIDGALSAEIGRLYVGTKEIGHYLTVVGRRSEGVEILADDGALRGP
jgi:hypothetical protein